MTMKVDNNYSKCLGGDLINVYIGRLRALIKFQTIASVMRCFQATENINPIRYLA